MDIIGRIPYIIAKVVFKISIILFVASLLISGLTFINIYTFIQTPIDIINNTLATNNYISPEVAYSLTGRDRMHGVTISGGNSLIGKKVGETGRIRYIWFTSTGNVLDIQPYVQIRDYGTVVDYTLNVRWDISVWTLFGSIDAPVTYSTRQSAVCYRKVR